MAKDEKQDEQSLDAAPEKDVNGIIWFGEVDINKRTELPASDYPSWYYDPQIRSLETDIEMITRNLDLDMYQGKAKVSMRAELARKQKRLSDIRESKPKLEGKKKDEVGKVFKSLGKRIGESMFSYSDMQRGTADAQEEANRMVGPAVKIETEMEAGFCRQTGIAITDGKISRNAACRMYKIFGKALGEGILDVEVLRNPR